MSDLSANGDLQWLVDCRMLRDLDYNDPTSEQVVTAMTHAAACAGVVPSDWMAAPADLAMPEQRERMGLACGCCGKKWAPGTMPVMVVAMTPVGKSASKSVVTVALVCARCAVDGTKVCRDKVLEFFRLLLGSEKFWSKEIASGGTA